MTDPLLDVRDLRVELDTRHGRLRPVDGVDLTLERGRTFALLGESGCGKSMTAYALMGLLPPGGRVTGGAIRLAGEDLLSLPEARMRRVRGGRMAMIFQEPQTSLNPVMSVGRQVEEVLSLHRDLGGRPRRAVAEELLRHVGIPDPRRRLQEYPHQLSGGMKQRVMVAMALAGEPDLLIADEPTTALDVTIQAQVLDLLRRLQAELSMTILLITHDLGVVAEMADRVAVMYAGQVVEQGDAAPFFDRPLHPYSRALFQAMPGMAKRGGLLAAIPGTVPALDRVFRGCRFAERCPRVQEPCRRAPPPLEEPWEGRAVRCILHDAPPGESPPPAAVAVESEGGPAPVLLEAEGLVVHFPIRSGPLRRSSGAVKAVDGVDLQVPEGRTVALVGESGCGKTTVGKALLQLLRPQGGSVRFAGEDLTRLGREALRRRRRELQIIFQDPYASMNPRMRVVDIVAEGLRSQGIGGDRKARAARVESLLDQVGLEAAMGRRFPHEFSGGQRQRICIARALAVSPRLVVCDEPTSALDVSVQAQILNLLRRLQLEMGLAYLFISHNISVVEFLAHEVAVMYLGRIVERGPATAVLQAPGHPYTQALLAAVPVADPGEGRPVLRLEGDLPSPSDPPAGCHFHPRCPRADARCRREYPGARETGGGQRVACHHPGP